MPDKLVSLNFYKLTPTIKLINLQAFLEHGIPRTPEMVVALMQKASSYSFCLQEISSKLFSLK